MINHIIEEKRAESKMTMRSLLKFNSEFYTDAIAFQSEKEEYSWGEAFNLICSLSNLMSSMGINKETRVLIVVERTIESTLLMYSLFVLGCTVFVSNKHKAEHFVEEGVEIDVAIVCEGGDFSEGVRVYSCHSLYEEALSKCGYYFRDYLLESEENDTQLVIFTSGTLGNSKGILLELSAFISNGKRFSECLRITNDDKYCIVTPLHHCFGIINLLSALNQGACVYFPSSNHYDIVLEELYQKECTVLNTVPTFFFGLQKTFNFSAEKVKCLKKGVIAGGNYSPEQFIEITEKFDINLLSSYGLTESCATVTFSSYEGDMTEKAYSVGSFIQGINGCIEDENGDDAVDGQLGEICICGKPLMKGYFSDGVLKHDFLDDRGFYHTGDLGYVDRKGYLHIVDRKKNVIICGGENISPQSVEKRILKSEDVDECIIIGLSDDYYGEIPCVAIKS